MDFDKLKVYGDTSITDGLVVITSDSVIIIIITTNVITTITVIMWIALQCERIWQGEVPV